MRKCPVASERSVFKENAGSEPFTRHSRCVTSKVNLLIFIHAIFIQMIRIHIKRLSPIQAKAFCVLLSLAFLPKPFTVTSSAGGPKGWLQRRQNYWREWGRVWYSERLNRL